MVLVKFTYWCHCTLVNGNRNGLNILSSYIDYFDLDTATIGLQTSSLFIGGCVAGLTWGKVTDILGRRPALFWAALITVFAVVLQTAAQNTAMFTVARVLIGFGTSASGLSGPVYLAETLPLHWRAWGLGIFNDCYYVGQFRQWMPSIHSLSPWLILYRRPYCSWSNLRYFHLVLDMVLANTLFDTGRDQSHLYRHYTIHTRITALAGLPRLPGRSADRRCSDLRQRRLFKSNCSRCIQGNYRYA